MCEVVNDKQIVGECFSEHTGFPASMVTNHLFIIAVTSTNSRFKHILLWV
jgi:hypothetical protein